tara:strand:+ start:306 stop:797 length:492 start_codon:yes stop_codon:yes gene_type:complete
MLTPIGNKEFDEASKDRNNINILNKACSRYIKSIPADELERCKLIALWEALKAFDPEKGGKFTSFLYKRADWECKKQLYAINKHSKSIEYQDNYCVSHARYVEIAEMKDLLQKLHPRLRTVIKQRFFDNLTMEEIGKKNNYSRETARRYILSALEKLKEYTSE